MRVTTDRGEVPTEVAKKEEYLKDDLHFGIMLCEAVKRRFLQNK